MELPELLDRIRRNGCEESFATVLRRYSRLVYSVSHRRLRDAFQADECAQEVFVQLVRKAPPLKNEAELVGWLHATAHRIAIDRWRRGGPAARPR